MSHVDATRITSKLYVGSAPRVDADLRLAGFDLVVFCASPRQYERLYRASGARLHAMFPGVEAIDCPLVDSSANGPSPGEFLVAQQTARRVAIAILRGRRVLLTCMEGRNRSAFVAALALHELTGRSGRDCAQKVREQRVAEIQDSVLFNTFFNAILDSISWTGPHTIEEPRPRASDSSGSVL